MRNGNDDRTAALEAELAEVQGRLHEAERDGAEIAALAERTIGNLRLENASLKAGTQEQVVFCLGCEWKRRAIAVLVGIFFLGMWFHAYPPGDADAELTWLGISLAVSPLLIVFARWRWLLFKRKYAWEAWDDNDIYRAIAERWNGLLQGIRMR